MILRLIAVVSIALLAGLPAQAQSELYVKQMTVSPEMRRAPPPADPQAFQAQLVNAIIQASNRKRAEAALPPLDWDPVLAETADRFARKMRDFQFFDHRSPAGQTLATRLPQDVLHRYAKLGENLWAAQGAVDWRAAKLAGEAADGWVESRTHRGNLLEPAFTLAGVGVAFSPERGVFISMMMARPKGAQPAVIGRPSPAPSVDLQGFAQTLPTALLDALNRARAQRGLSALRPDPALSEIALRHSEGLLASGAFTETGTAGVSVLDRAVDATSGRFSRMALGLWHGYGGLTFETGAIVGSAMKTWQERSGTLDDMLDSGFDLAGLGVATDGNRVLVTALYGDSVR